MNSIQIEGASLYCEVIGQGDPLVLVHGSASDSRTWARQREAFSRGFRTIVYSRRYHWPNEPISEGVDYSMEQHVQDLTSLIRSLDLAPVHLVGHSYGGFVSLLVAMRNPELVRTLVLAEPPAITLFVSSTPKLLEILRLLLSRPRTALALVKFGSKGVVPAQKAFKRGDSSEAIRRFAEAVFGPGGYDRFSEERKKQVNANLTNVKAEVLGSDFLPVDPDQVRRLEMPTLLLTGEHSIELFRLLVDRFEELIPHTDRVEIPGGSHTMNEDNPPAFNAAVLNFLATAQAQGL